MKRLLTISNDEMTMSSREIAELTGKQHKHVIRDIKTMLDALGDGSDLDHVREERDRRDYTSCIHLNKELTETLVTGYSIPLRHKVIKRLHQLENELKGNRGLPAWIQNLSPQALTVIEDQSSTIQHLQSETKRLNTVCNDLAANLKDGLTPVEFCRMLNGVHLNRVQSDLVERKRLLKTEHGYRTPAAYRGDLFIERRHFNKEGRLCEKVVLTQKGAKWLYAEYEKGRLTMRKDWDGSCSHLAFESGAAA
ncbi:Phage regulatory protein Rha (Phage_pRha) [Marinobacter sp. LV10R510-11A]|uniref:Rha family transcriptional regulator n=1 Tax=Marinobacter sp. LV10R510-11A TaxID=1415568 RepID=UPI000BB92EF1|nr:Rha family transcriptional regulator [Marinobacter sp. LV10R510-11A]SOB76159.1 Phage regulatory protein Rha (Phage_pRha) [Marinobacter sp. LV10R510-11A]